MVKTKSTKKASAGKKGSKVAKLTRSVVAGLDENARKWRALLDDPCGAELTRPCYAGTGTGYLARYRTIIPIQATAVDYVFEFTPSYGTGEVFRYGWSATAGGTLGTAGAYALGGIVDTPSITGRSRCVAACVKVVYTGAELTRAGIIGYACDSGATLEIGEAIAADASGFLCASPHTERLGSREGEYRWVPGPGDEFFRSRGVNSEEIETNETNGNSLQVVISGAPAGTYSIQVVSVWEWQPAEEAAGGSRLIVQNSPPASRNSLNDVLRSVGDYGTFLREGLRRSAPYMMRGIQGAANTILTRMGPALLTM